MLLEVVDRVKVHSAREIGRHFRLVRAGPGGDDVQGPSDGPEWDYEWHKWSFVI